MPFDHFHSYYWWNIGWIMCFLTFCPETNGLILVTMIDIPFFPPSYLIIPRKESPLHLHYIPISLWFNGYSICFILKSCYRSPLWQVFPSFSKICSRYFWPVPVARSWWNQHFESKSPYTDQIPKILWMERILPQLVTMGLYWDVYNLPTGAGFLPSTVCPCCFVPTYNDSFL